MARWIAEYTSNLNRGQGKMEKFNADNLDTAYDEAYKRKGDDYDLDRVFEVKQPIA